MALALVLAVGVLGGAGVGTAMAGAPAPRPPAPSASTAVEQVEPAAAAPSYPSGSSGTHEVRRWVEQDRADAPPADSVLFIGSSSIRRWESLSRDLPEYHVVQRGWGGSVMRQVLAETPWLVAPLAPRAVVLRTGLNDLRAGGSPERLAADVRDFITLVRAARPDAQVLVLAIAPTPATVDSGDGIERARRDANRLLAADAAADPGVHWVDIATPFEQLVTTDRTAFDRLSIDGIHLTPAGYAAWLEVLRPVLDSAVGPSQAALPTMQGLRAGERLMLDLGADDGAIGVPTGVDAEGLHWNDWWSTAPGGDVVAGEHLGSLVTSEGRVTGVAMTVTGGFRASTAAEAGPIAPDPAALGELAVPSATRDAWISTADDRPGGDDDLPGGFLLEGLDPELRYALRVVGSSPGAPRSTAELIVHGAAGGAAQLRTGGPGAGRETAAIGDLVPDARGRLWVDVRVVQGAQASLNAVELVAAEPVQP